MTQFGVKFSRLHSSTYQYFYFRVTAPCANYFPMCYSRVEYGANIAPHRNKQLAWKNLAYLRDEYGSIQICKFIQPFLPKNLFSNISSLYVVCNIFQVNCVFTSSNTIKIKTSIKASVAERKLFNFSPGPSFVPCFGLHPGSESGCSGQKKDIHL